MIEQSKDAGFTVFANNWGLGKVFGGEHASVFLGEHPEAHQELTRGKKLYGACFNHPAFVEYSDRFVRNLIDLEPDYVFWDEPRWIDRTSPTEGPTQDWGCACEYCRSAYRERYDEPLPEEMTDNVREFKESVIRDYLEKYMNWAREAGVKNTVCLLPHGKNHAISDWDSIAAMDPVDMFATDPYWAFWGEPVESFVESAADRLSSIGEVHDVETQLWIQGFDLPKEETKNVATATKIAVESDVDSVFMWGWDGARVMSESAAAEPGAVWDAYISTI
jgi:hypothetical protein